MHYTIPRKFIKARLSRRRRPTASAPSTPINTREMTRNSDRDAESSLMYASWLCCRREVRVCGPSMVELQSMLGNICEQKQQLSEVLRRVLSQEKLWDFMSWICFWQLMVVATGFIRQGIDENLRTQRFSPSGPKLCGREMARMNLSVFSSRSAQSMFVTQSEMEGSCALKQRSSGKQGVCACRLNISCSRRILLWTSQAQATGMTSWDMDFFRLSSFPPMRPRAIKMKIARMMIAVIQKILLHPHRYSSMPSSIIFFSMRSVFSYRYRYVLTPRSFPMVRCRSLLELRMPWLSQEKSISVSSNLSSNWSAVLFQTTVNCMPLLVKFQQSLLRRVRVSFSLPPCCCYRGAKLQIQLKVPLFSQWMRMLMLKLYTTFNFTDPISRSMASRHQQEEWGYFCLCFRDSTAYAIRAACLALCFSVGMNYEMLLLAKEERASPKWFLKTQFELMISPWLKPERTMRLFSLSAQRSCCTQLARKQCFSCYLRLRYRFQMVMWQSRKRNLNQLEQKYIL